MEIKVFKLDQDISIFKKGVMVVIIKSPININIKAKFGTDYYNWDDDASSILMSFQQNYKKDTGGHIDELLYKGGDNSTNLTILKLIFNEKWER